MVNCRYAYETLVVAVKGIFTKVKARNVAAIRTGCRVVLVKTKGGRTKFCTTDRSSNVSVIFNII